jgi:hypothetical protein
VLHTHLPPNAPKTNYTDNFTTELTAHEFVALPLASLDIAPGRSAYREKSSKHNFGTFNDVTAEGMLRASAIIKLRVSSAAERVLPPGVFITRMPLRV